MNLFDYVVPIKLYLHILQLEEYKPVRFLRWIYRNFFVRKISIKKPLVYTAKVKNIILIYIIICLIGLFVNFFLFLFLLIQPYIGLVLALLVLKPYEIYSRKKTIEETRNKILSIRNLKVIGITGSFGKSSTKEILYQLLKDKYKVLRTPESFNTVLGIAKVVDLELDNIYEYFICEMAAYKIGEIKELCYMALPKFGILTGITTQHLERFGSLENTIKAKFELVDSISEVRNIIFNLDDSNITGELKKRNIKNPNGFLKTKNVSFNKNGSSFEIIFDKKVYKTSSPLFGFANVKNITAASSMAIKLGIPVSEVVEAIRKLKPVDNRLALTSFGKTTLLDNTYSSNPQGFKETIETAKKVRGKKVLVTPGLVELGKLEEEIHNNLGELSKGVFDKVILVGKNRRTESFAKGLGENPEYIKDSREEYFRTIENLKGKYDWIFLENDVTENY